MNRTIGLFAVALCVAVLGATAHAEPFAAPRTDFGHPDLQGTWTNATITALERPDQFDRLVLTEAEAAEWERRTAGFFEAIDDIPEGGLQAGEDVGGYNSFWMDPGTRALRVDGEPRSSIITSPSSGKLPYRLGARIKLINFMGNVINAFDGPEQRPLGERCVVGFGSTGGPPMLPVLYNNNYQIVQTPDHVMIHVEMNHDARIIRLGGEHPPAQVRPWMGDSIGRWEDGALVVETTNFHPGQTFRAAVKHQLLLSPEGVVTETLRRVGQAEIKYSFEVEDPALYTEPWRGEITFRPADGQIYEYACHEGNYALPGILAGARLEEAEEAGGQ
ncbi:MAG: hypothetical protein OXJ53_00405 [Gammaproteobacteria bacterium]|nr:hypothetical protein [Gammaproteobacteria bacterium]MDD9961350.1 hypothetical protein [Gammaproteobacteria bacterium]MDE0273382.1 hypothetical protein [Gammaproteobacteria bacterium]